MRLISVASEQMVDSINPSPYAILSHTWGNEEVTFADYNGTKPYQTMKGYKKIKFTLEQARKDDIHFVWIDTCNIDKRSSAELSEAINSMYKWYENAKICYAYLEDVPTTGDRTLSFSKSRWFQRGWTLQELLASPKVEFYGKDWVHLGSKESLRDHITERTGIPPLLLQNPSLITMYSVAARMSWAAFRETTRKEDRAYSLLGIFNVHMPLLYGEGGEKAFRRLQEEIMKEVEDETLFAWGEHRHIAKVFASDPDCFAGAANIVSKKHNFEAEFPRQDKSPRKHTTVTSRGLLIEAPLCRMGKQDDEGRDVLGVVLRCCRVTSSASYLVLPVVETAIPSVFQIDRDSCLFAGLPSITMEGGPASTAVWQSLHLVLSGTKGDRFSLGNSMLDLQIKVSPPNDFTLQPILNHSFTSWIPHPTKSRYFAQTTCLLPFQTKLVYEFCIQHISGNACIVLIKSDVCVVETALGRPLAPAAFLQVMSKPDALSTPDWLSSYTNTIFRKDDKKFYTHDSDSEPELPHSKISLPFRAHGEDLVIVTLRLFRSNYLTVEAENMSPSDSRFKLAEGLVGHQIKGEVSSTPTSDRRSMFLSDLVQSRPAK